MASYIDRYRDFNLNGSNKIIPGISIPQTTSDKTIIYKLGQTRLDKLSNIYYGTPYYGWLIMLANPQYGGLEFLIPDQSRLRIPLPFESAIESYNAQVKKYNILYAK